MTLLDRLYTDLGWLRLQFKRAGEVWPDWIDSARQDLANSIRDRHYPLSGVAGGGDRRRKGRGRENPQTTN